MLVKAPVLRTSSRGMTMFHGLTPVATECRVFGWQRAGAETHEGGP